MNAGLRSLLFALVSSTCLTVSHPAEANDEAERLFQEGRQFMAEGRLGQACPALEESLKLERGIGTLLNLAKCYELQGKPATAWKLYGESSELAAAEGDDKRQVLAEQQQARIAARIPQVRITLEELTAETQLTLDGEPLDKGVLEEPFPMDPGTHVLTVTQPGAEPHSVSFQVLRLKEGETRRTRVHVPALRARPTESGSSEQPGPPPPQVQESQSGLYWAGLSTLGLGLALGGVGMGLGIDAKSQGDNADCDQNNFCTPLGLEQRDAARKQLRTGYILGVAGAAVVVAGSVTLIVAGLKERHSRRALQAEFVAGNALGLRLRGSF